MAAPDVTRAGVALGLVLLACAGPAIAQETPATGVERRQSYPTTPPAEEAVPLLDFSAALRGGVQWIVNPPRARDDVFGFGALDLVLTVRPTPDITLLVDVEALGGPGPDQALGTLSRLNQEAERLEGREARAFLREAWVRVQWLDGTVRFNVGKLDPGHYFDRNFFAEDETRQFLDAALLANPLLKAPPNGPGTSLRISQGDWRYAFGVHAPGDFDDDLSGLPYFIAELGRRNIFPLKGHYRWWARVTSVADRRDDVTWATGLSIDQLVTDNTGLFLRAGLARSEGETFTAHAWSAGVQHTPTWLGRPRDLTGIGYSFQHEAPGREHAAEAYYNVSLAPWCSVIANLQWIFSGPNQVTGGRNRDVIVPGVRMLLLY